MSLNVNGRNLLLATESHPESLIRLSTFREKLATICETVHRIGFNAKYQNAAAR